MLVSQSIIVYMLMMNVFGQVLCAMNVSQQQMKLQKVKDQQLPDNVTINGLIPGGTLHNGDLPTSHQPQVHRQSDILRFKVLISLHED